MVEIDNSVIREHKNVVEADNSVARVHKTVVGRTIPWLGYGRAVGLATSKIHMQLTFKALATSTVEETPMDYYPSHTPNQELHQSYPKHMKRG